MNFEDVYKINVNEHTEEKNGLTYLSWAYAWREFKKIYPDATYEIKKWEDNLPYVYDMNTGYMVFTSVTANGLTYEMWLPVMDNANKTMKAEPYTYQVKEYKYGKWTGNYIDKTVESATMFDINKTIMRCLVKNLAMFGLGLYIYAGEDLPEEEKITKETITINMEESLRESIKNNKISTDKVKEVLDDWGYEKLNEIKVTELMDFRKRIGIKE